MAKYRFRNLMVVRPGDVVAGDAFAVKVVAVAGRVFDWAAYVGPSDWSDQQVAESGDKLLEEQAKSLFYVMRTSGRVYRH